MDSGLKKKKKPHHYYFCSNLNFRIVLLGSFWLTFGLNGCKAESTRGSGQWKERRDFTATDTSVRAGGAPALGSVRDRDSSESHRVTAENGCFAFSLFTFRSCLVHPCTPCHGSPWEASHTPSDKGVTCLNSILQLLLCMWLFTEYLHASGGALNHIGLVNYLLIFFFSK